jgi:hypothetical protein
MTKLYFIEYTLSGVNRQETGLTKLKADNRRTALEDEGAQDIRIMRDDYAECEALHKGILKAMERDIVSTLDIQYPNAHDKNVAVAKIIVSKHFNY